MPRLSRSVVFRPSTLVLGACALLAAAGVALAGGSWNYYSHESGWRSEGGRRHHSNDGHVFPQSRALPNPELTPGATNPAVTQANIDQTICVRGYTRTIRPPENYTERLKRKQIREYGYSDHHLGAYEEDHLISLEIGGSPTSPQNLWPEPHNIQGGWGSYTKDQLENRLNHMVCRGEISLVEAQSLIAHNWIAAYQRYISPTPLADDPQDRY